MVYDKELKLASSIDMVFIDQNNDFIFMIGKDVKKLKKMMGKYKIRMPEQYILIQISGITLFS